MNWNMELMQPKRQRVWGFPAVVNFILGGTGAGFYLLFSVYELLQAGPLPGPQPGGAKILSPVLVCLGFLALTLESGRPLRGVYLLSNLRSSWVSIEVLAGALFISVSILDWLSPSPILHIFASCAALGFAVSQGFIVYRARAITAWNVPVVPLIFLLSAFVMGGGLLLMVSAFQHLILKESIFLIVLVCLVLDMGVWAVYLNWSHNADFMQATAFLRRHLSLFLVIGFGHLFPLAMLAGIVMMPGASYGTGLYSPILALAGLSIIAGGAIQKIFMSLGADFLRGVVMGRPKDNTQSLRKGYAPALGEHLPECNKISADPVKKQMNG